jgi:predicted DCC family thiol-disulfide oxidoreductase YuxK
MARPSSIAATPTLIYDGECGFCTASVRFVERWVRPRCNIEAWQLTDLRSRGISRQRAEHEVLWVTSAGAVYGGAHAVARLLLNAGRSWRGVGALLMVPPFSWLARVVYTIVARYRGRLPGGTPACALPPERRPGGLTRDLGP